MNPSYASRYRELWDTHWWWRSRASWLLGWIDRIDRRRPCRRILDVGCGDGLFFEDLGRFGQVQGLEPDETLLADSPRREAIHVAPLDRRFHAEKPFDLILLLDVLEHIEDDDEALRSAHRALQPGGRLLLTVPALPMLWSRHDVVNGHHRRYLPRELRDRLRAAGFRVEDVRYFFLWTVVPLLLRRHLSPAAGIDEYDVPIPPRRLNAALRLFSRIEHAIARVVRFPVGSSLLAVAERSEAPA